MQKGEIQTSAVLGPFREAMAVLRDVIVARSFQNGIAAFGACREFGLAAFGSRARLLDALSSLPHCIVERMDSGSAVVSCDGLFAWVEGLENHTHVSLNVRCWARTTLEADAFRKNLETLLGDNLCSHPRFCLIWKCVSAKGDLLSVPIEEIADPPPIDEAYPCLHRGAAQFIESYLEAPETVLVLQGPPGTGKTRLIRSILSECSRRSEYVTNAVFTTDASTLDTDALFMKFLTGDERFLIVEDADQLLNPRSQGNALLRRFLAVADGVVTARGRKIVFSTNLEEVDDIDPALIRPGRCFARVEVRRHTKREAIRFLHALAARDRITVEGAIHKIERTAEDTYSLAEIYRLIHRENDVPEFDQPIRKPAFGFAA